MVSITPPALYLCECKFWKRAAPQEIVHAFRTVLVDVGAHRGFIISSSGFQEGAYAAARNTNIDLLTFAELQAIFADRWRVSMGERLMPYADRLFPYWDPSGGRMPTFQWNKTHLNRHRQLMEAYEPLIWLGPSSQFQQFRRQFPLTLPAVNALGEIEGQVVISYRQLFDFIERNEETARYHFQVLHGEVAPHRLAGEYDPRSVTA